MKEMTGVICTEKALIDGKKYPNIEEMTPKELFFLPTGAIGDRPSFVVAMTNFPKKRSAYGQFSLDTLRSVLNEIGFDITSFCKGNCGMNYCDENGCVERKRELASAIASMPDAG